MTAKTKTPLDEAIEQYANRRCDEIQKRRDMGLAPYPIRPAIVADCRYIAEWLARELLKCKCCVHPSLANERFIEPIHITELTGVTE